MPTNRTRLKRERRQFQKLPKIFYVFFCTGDEGSMKDSDYFDLFLLTHQSRKNELRKLWDNNREDITREWIRQHPGSRPFAWWEFDAPEYRRRIAGTGIVAWDDLNLKPYYFKGVPKMFHSLNEDDPTTYESEAFYLKRNGLLMEGEEKRLTEDDFAPEKVTGILGDKLSLHLNPQEIDELLKT